MSTQSGITTSEELLESFKSLSSSPLVIRVSEDNTQLIPDPDFEPKNSKNGDLEAAFKDINTYLSKIHPQPSYVVIPIDADSEDFVFISFIPDVAPIRSKMLYASTKSTLVSSLGSGKFSKTNTFAWTELEELTYENYQFVTAGKDEEGPLSEKEKVLNELNSLQNLSLTQQGSTSSFKRELASMHSPSPSANQSDNLLFRFDDALQKEFDTLPSNSDNNTLLAFNIDKETEKITLTAKEVGVEVDQLIDTLSRANSVTRPQYSVYNYHRGKFAFIYSCPSNSAVKDRMLYASSKLTLIKHLKALLAEHNFTIDKSIEVGDLIEIELSELSVEPEVASPGSVSSSASSTVGRQGLKFNKPKGPRRR
ncbi:Twinfilin A [Scheffersomyces xylosifermentans]|uniref:Twinfilin A n=1 Tax=Scheffersomyces xylosifermentans TaxID=1304137 RepID=UPI00315DC8D4